LSTASIEQTGTFLKKIRARYIVQRLIRILTIALLVDLVMDLLTITLFNLWQFKLSIPFLFEILFAVLILRDRATWKLEKIGIELDRRFSLKDRLYSFTWYQSHDTIPPEIRQAQAEETVSAVDLQHILKSNRLRVPLLLPIALPLFAGLLYLSWNSEYRPSGITTRVVQRGAQQLSKSGIEIAGLGGRSESNRGKNNENHGDPGADELPTVEQGNNTTSPKGLDDDNFANNRSGLEADRPGELSERSLESDPGVETSGAGGGPGGVGDPGSGMGEHPTGGATPPENIDSVFLTESISEPIPPALAMNSSFMFQGLPDATNFLSLVPGQGGQALAPLNPDIISNFEREIYRLPEAYQKHLQIYYLELKKWEQTP
jgi:hypothetical protein